MLNNLNRSQKQQVSKITKVIFILLVLVGAWYVLIYSKNSPQQVSSQQNTSTEIAPPTATIELNKTFNIPLTDENQKAIADLNYEIESAEIRKEILVQGSKASAVDGRAFLIINLKIGNESERGVNVNTRNYLRLSTNGNEEEWLAPDIHNDPVEVQAISTKKTRIGFPVNDSDKNLVLQFGDITGEKEKIQLNFDTVNN
jgi:hypothetical protein